MHLNHVTFAKIGRTGYRLELEQHAFSLKDKEIISVSIMQRSFKHRRIQNVKNIFTGWEKHADICSISVPFKYHFFPNH